MPGVGIGWDAYSMAMLLKKIAVAEGGSVSFPCYYQLYFTYFIGFTGFTELTFMNCGKFLEIISKYG